MSNPWVLHERPDGLALLELNVPTRPVNTLGRITLDALRQIAEQLTRRNDLRGLILRSGKPGRCIAGADLTEIAGADRTQHARLINAGLAAFDLLARLPFPTVGLIDGACLGGGLELFLALDDRLASDAPHTLTGLPEVKLALIPAWGGTQRLPRLIGLPALDLIIGGEPITARRAKFLGLVHDTLPAADLLDAAAHRIAALRSSDTWERRRERSNDRLDLGPSLLHQTIDSLSDRVRASRRDTAGAAERALGVIRDGAPRALGAALAIETTAAIETFGTTEAQTHASAFLHRKKRVQSS